MRENIHQYIFQLKIGGHIVTKLKKFILNAFKTYWFIILLVTVTFSLIALTLNKYSVTTNFQIKQPSNLYEEFILTSLSSNILEAIKKHHGDYKQYWQDKIICLKRQGDTRLFDITVEIETFEGAHNPPYGLETITFRQDIDGLHIFDYQHKDE